ncbi:hypothetical protein [Synechocystis sp. LKSZ1]|uniref:hypothetical protein n=1 Tax=Synechocystis sp. LKSZ1 TaxID=3144951 RepID=UPI00336C1881
MDSSIKLTPNPAITQVFTPANTAIFTSVGLHAFILGLILPSFHWNEPPAPSERSRETVGVIELSPAEQSRLPHPSPLTTNVAVLPNPAVPGANPALPSLPSSDYNYNNIPGLNAIPAPPALPNLPSYPPNLPPLSSYGNLSNLPIAAPPVSLPPLPSIPPLPNSRRLPSLPGLPFGNNGNAIDRDQASAPQRPNFGELQPMRGTDFITRAPQPPGEQLETLQATGEDTPIAQARNNDLIWQARQGATIKERITLTGAYPRIACRNQTEATVVYNVAPDGELTPISTSRYPIFNEIAQKAIAGQSVRQPTQISVNFRYDPQLCASLGVVPTPSQTLPSLPDVNPTNNQAPRPSLPNNTPAPIAAPPTRPTLPPPADNSPETVAPAQIPAAQPRSVRPTLPEIPLPQTPPANSLPDTPVTVPNEATPPPVDAGQPAKPPQNLLESKGSRLQEQQNNRVNSPNPREAAPLVNNSPTAETEALPGPALGKKE